MIFLGERKIIIEIDENGRIIADAEGFKGPICLKELEDLLSDIGTIDKIDKKPDYFSVETKHFQHTKITVKK